jgi:hypothetical protein
MRVVIPARYFAVAPTEMASGDERSREERKWGQV